MPLIVVEGLDGAGKSTQIARMQHYFSGKHQRCRYLHFPRTDAPVYGELIARFLRGDLGSIDEVNPYLVALLYAGDRLGFKPTLQEWLADESVVLLDRYVYSNIAYQCAKVAVSEREALKQWILDVEFGHHALPVPDVHLFLDVPFKFTRQKLEESRSGVSRDYLRGKKDIHETDLEFQQRVREMYLSLNDSPGFYRVDCSGSDQGMLPPDGIFTRILEVLQHAGVI